MPAAALVSSGIRMQWVCTLLAVATLSPAASQSPSLNNHFTRLVDHLLLLVVAMAATKCIGAAVPAIRLLRGYERIPPLQDSLNCPRRCHLLTHHLRWKRAVWSAPGPLELNSANVKFTACVFVVPGLTDHPAVGIWSSIQQPL